MQKFIDLLLFCIICCTFNLIERDITRIVASVSIIFFRFLQQLMFIIDTLQQLL